MSTESEFDAAADAARRSSHVPAEGAEVVPPPARLPVATENAGPPAGWYPSPAPGTAPGIEMYWDGVQWHTAMLRGGMAPAAAPAAAPGSAAPVAPGSAAAVVAGTGATASTAPVARTTAPSAPGARTTAPWAADAVPAPVGAAVGVAPGVVLAAEPSAAAAQPKRPWFRRKGVLIPVGVLAGLIVVSSIVNAVGGDDDTAAAPPTGLTNDADTAQVAEEPEPELEPELEPVMVAVPNVIGMDGATARATIEALGLAVEYDGDDTMPVLTQDVAEGVEVEEGSVIVLTVEEKPQLTLGQQNAIGSAESYLGFTAFSRAGLLQQLTSEYGEGYREADAEFAIAYLEENGLVDWKAEAVESAESYLDFSSFSRDGLYDQLTSEYGEGFTHKQAEYALGEVGY